MAIDCTVHLNSNAVFQATGDIRTVNVFDISD